jgi:cell division protein FtsZ
VTFAIAINPFSYEDGRMKKAGEGIRRLREITETTVVLDNDRLLQYAGDVPVSEAFAVMDRSIIKIIDSLCLQIGESFISQITPEIEEMVQRIDEEEKSLSPLAAPEAALIHASIGELGGEQPETELPDPADLR